MKTFLFFAAIGLLILNGASTSYADDAAISKELALKDVKIKVTDGIATEIEVHDPSKLTDDDFHHIAQLVHLKKLQFGKGFSNQQLSLLVSLPDVTAIATNGADLDDEGVAQFSHFKKLQSVTLFHQNRNFKGTGLEKLASLADLENLTVSGNVIADDAFEAISKLQHLKSLRSWHNRADPHAVAVLKNIPGLTSVFLGDPLVSDETITSLAAIPTLESITVMEAHFSYDVLSQLKQLASLKRLMLMEIEISDGDLQKLHQLLPKVDIKRTAPGPQALSRIKAQDEKQQKGT